MIVVYWLEGDVKDYPEVRYEDFQDNQLTEVLEFMERLRKDEGISFVTMCSQNPNSVGKPGVAEADKSYNWTKRRYNERPVLTDEVPVPLDDE